MLFFFFLHSPLRRRLGKTFFASGPILRRVFRNDMFYGEIHCSYIGCKDDSTDSSGASWSEEIADEMSQRLSQRHCRRWKGLFPWEYWWMNEISRWNTFWMLRMRLYASRMSFGNWAILILWMERMRAETSPATSLILEKSTLCSISGGRGLFSLIHLMERSDSLRCESLSLRVRWNLHRQINWTMKRRKWDQRRSTGRCLWFLQVMISWGKWYNSPISMEKVNRWEGTGEEGGKTVFQEIFDALESLPEECFSSRGSVYPSSVATSASPVESRSQLPSPNGIAQPLSYDSKFEYSML